MNGRIRFLTAGFLTYRLFYFILLHFPQEHISLSPSSGPSLACVGYKERANVSPGR